MKTLIAVAAASIIAIAAATPADAAQGCGRGMHRTPHGRCVPNGGMRDGMRTTWVVGQFYPGHGYWYNNQWYQHRMRDRNRGWRYR
jgi:hypothetical protein